MATIRKEITATAKPDQIWAAIQDIGALHTRLVPGFVIDTKLEPGARIVTFANGITVRERIVTIDDQAKRLVWSVVSERFTHHNGSHQVFVNADGETNVVWIADLLPDEAAGMSSQIMDHGMSAMKTALDVHRRPQANENVFR
jgi:hypothetical protein